MNLAYLPFIAEQLANIIGARVGVGTSPQCGLNSRNLLGVVGGM